MNPNTQLLAHVGVELVVIAGLTAWTNSRISSLNNTVLVLRETIQKLESVINAHEHLLSTHEMVLRSIGNQPMQIPTIVKKKVPKKSEPEQGVLPEVLDDILKEELMSIDDNTDDEELKKSPRKLKKDGRRKQR